VNSPHGPALSLLSDSRALSAKRQPRPPLLSRQSAECPWPVAPLAAGAAFEVVAVLQGSARSPICLDLDFKVQLLGLGLYLKSKSNSVSDFRLDLDFEVQLGFDLDLDLDLDFEAWTLVWTLAWTLDFGLDFGSWRPVGVALSPPPTRRPPRSETAAQAPEI
jgi:hypothetical protein